MASTLKFHNIINGELRTSDKAHQVPDPRTEELLWDAPLATLADLDEAVKAAQQAQKTWGKSTIEERRAVLARIIEVFQANKEELFAILMKETGKSVGHPPSGARESRTIWS